MSNSYEIKKGYGNGPQIDNKMVKNLLEDGVGSHLAISRLLGRDARHRLNTMVENGELFMDQVTGLGGENRKNVYYIQNYANKKPLLFAKALPFELAGIAVGLLRETYGVISAFAPEDSTGYDFTGVMENGDLIEIRVITSRRVRDPKEYHYGKLRGSRYRGSLVVYVYEDRILIERLLKRQTMGLWIDNLILMYPETTVLNNSVIAGVFKDRKYNSHLEYGIESHPKFKLEDPAEEEKK